MKIEKQIKLITELETDEVSCIKKTVKILRQVEELMEKHDCDTFTCFNEYTYDIEDLKRVIDDLDNFAEIDEIFA